MHKTPTLPLAVLGIAGAFVTHSFAQDSGALLDALVQEGVLKESKAEQIRAKLSKDFSNTSAGKIQLDNSIKSIRFSGDARFRYQWDQTQLQDRTRALSDSRNTQRERIRLRLGVDAKLAEDFFAGFQLSTGQTADSDNQTVGQSSGGAGLGKYSIYISRAFLGWEPTKGLTGVIGKQPNPFYGNDQGLVWDADINPVGLSEKAELHKLFSWTSPWEVTVTAGQFVYADNNEGWLTGSNGTDKANDALLFQAQAAVAYKFNDANKVTVAPGFLTYNAASTSNNTNSNAAPFTADNGTRELQLLLLPGDFSTKIAGIKTKFLWDFSYNLAGKNRGKDIYGETVSPNFLYDKRDNLAWLLGIQLGENKAKGDISFLANYRQVGLNAVDPNLNDSDFGASKLNIEGFKLGLGYNLSKSVVLNLTYQNAFNLRNNLDSNKSNTVAARGLADINSNQIFQADVTVKF